MRIPITEELAAPRSLRGVMMFTPTDLSEVKAATYYVMWGMLFDPTASDYYAWMHLLSVPSWRVIAVTSGLLTAICWRYGSVGNRIVAAWLTCGLSAAFTIGFFSAGWIIAGMFYLIFFCLDTSWILWHLTARRRRLIHARKQQLSEEGNRGVLKESVDADIRGA